MARGLAPHRTSRNYIADLGGLAVQSLPKLDASSDQERHKHNHQCQLGDDLAGHDIDDRHFLPGSRIDHAVKSDGDEQHGVERLRRELLVRDEKRLEYLATRVFAEPFREIMRVGRDLKPDNFKPSFLAASALALTIGHFTLEPVRRYLMPSDTPEDLRQTIIDHVTKLALEGMAKDRK